MRSTDWIKAAGRTTLGLGVVAAPVTASLLAFDEAPAAATWHNGACTSYSILFNCLSRDSSSAGVSHEYLGTFHRTDPSYDSPDWGHIEVSVAGNVYNTGSQSIYPGSTISKATGKFAGTHGTMVELWAAQAHGDPLGYHGRLTHTF